MRVAEILRALSILALALALSEVLFNAPSWLSAYSLGVEAIVLGLFIYELDIPRLATGKVLPGYVRAHAAVVAGLIPILLRSGLLTWVVAFGILLLVGTAVFSAVLRRLDL